MISPTTSAFGKRKGQLGRAVYYSVHTVQGSFSKRLIFRVFFFKQLWEPSRGQECDKFFWASISQLTDWKKDKYITD